jgi:hypothetical protein
MRQTRIGELLGKMVRLSNHDVEEILQEQGFTHRRFGEIALSWGLCQPEHIWRAWCDQINDKTEQVDLQELGIDAQAVTHLPKELATQHCLIPIRSFADQLVLASGEETNESLCTQLGKVLNKQVKFVKDDPSQVRDAIEKYYCVA